MRQRAPLVLSITALIVAVFGATPLGHAAGQFVSAVPPFAKTAGHAKVAANSLKLNGRRSTLTGAPGTIPVVGMDGKLPASIGAVGAQGPQGPKGDAGATGATGAKGDKGAEGATNVTIRQASITNGGSGSVYTGGADCQPGEKATGGGYFLTVNASPYISTPQPNGGGTPTGWYAAVIVTSATSSIGRVLVVCAAP